MVCPRSLGTVLPSAGLIPIAELSLEGTSAIEEIMKITASGSWCRIARADCRPSMMGITMSMHTMSGLAEWKSLMPSAPLEASPTTSKLGMAPMISHSWAAALGESSTMITFLPMGTRVNLARLGGCLQ